MKRSPHSSSCSSSPSYSSSSSSFATSTSSSCVGSESDVPRHHSSQPGEPKSKRARKINKKKKISQEKCQNATSPTSSRRSSIYRGVTRHRWTGRFEAHLWDKSTWNNIQNKKGRQVYLGAYDSEEAAARTYDLAALKYWGSETTLNFPVETYAKEIEEMQKVTKEEYLASLRRRSSGFSRGVSKYRGVARHHHNGRWEARIGRVFGNKYLYLGTYNTQEEAAEAYDMAAIEYRGPNAVTNFDTSNYIDRLRKKGVNIPQQPQQPSLCNCASSDNEEQLAEVEQSPPSLPPSIPLMSQNQQQLQDLVLMPLQCSLFPQCVADTSNTGVMDAIGAEQELDWSFCLDSGLTPFPMPDLSIENSYELPDLFNNDVGFEDNIDLIFDTTCSEGNQTEYVSDNSVGGCGVGEVGVPISIDGKANGKGGLLSASSSSSYSPASSTTSGFL